MERETHRLEYKVEDDICLGNQVVNEGVQRDQTFEDLPSINDHNGVDWDAIHDLFLEGRRSCEDIMKNLEK